MACLGGLNAPKIENSIVLWFQPVCSILRKQSSVAEGPGFTLEPVGEAMRALVGLFLGPFFFPGGLLCLLSLSG